jgi:general secretion pathway protein G
VTLDWWPKLILLAAMGCGVAGARQVRAATDFLALGNALQTFHINAGRFPTVDEGLMALVEKPVTYPENRRWQQVMKKIPADPWGRPYFYITSPSLEDGYGLYSNGRDGVSHSNGNDPDDWNSWSEDHQMGYGQRASLMNRVKESPLSFALAMSALVLVMAAAIRARRAKVMKVMK